MARGRVVSVGGLSRRSQRRKPTWGLGPGGTGATQFSTTTPAFVGSGFAINIDGITLVRLRGYLRCVLRSVAALGDNLTGAFGIMVVKTPAFVAGISAVPTPITDQADDDWMFWTPVSVGSMATTAQWGSAGWAVFDLVVDTKAMRKVSVGDTIYAAIEFGTEVGTTTVDVFFDSRILALLT